MYTHLLSIATTLPSTNISTASLLSELGGKLSPSLVKTIQNMGVENRYSVLHNVREIILGKEEMQAATTATELGALAVKKSLACADVAPDQVGLLIAVTNTQSRLLPGLASDLMASLHGILKPDISIINMQGLGCAGLLKAVEVAQWYLFANPNKKVLVVISEAATPYTIKHLCCRQYYSFREIKAMADPSAEQLAMLRSTEEVIQAFLFGDGAVALLLGSQNNRSGASFGSICHLTNENPDDANLLVMSDGGTEHPAINGVPQYWMRREVPRRGTAYAEATVKALLKQPQLPINHLSQAKVCLMHTGSRKILDGVSKKLGLSPRSPQVALSYDILRKYGNLSSASVGFMLAEGQFTSGIGIIVIFGIGFTASAGIVLFE
ncbi:hypothetical protein [Coleofasciculus sp. F4-SAH-05]|uniref:hypothetical protein n=1 Tax=Coleofasciculus sp. F4-SAH-05 TaxID=3069525 RepID=UPI0032FCEFF8